MTKGKGEGVKKKAKTAKKAKASFEVEPSNLWWCCTCRTQEMSHPEMIEHLGVAHDLTRPFTARRELVEHIDGDTWFSYQYRFTFGEGAGAIVLTNTVVRPRAKDDMMRFA